jgi:hypothetical protein
MPDLSRCVKDRNGNIWCWDLENESVLQVEIKKTAVGKVPQEVLFELLRAAERERKALLSAGAESDGFA